MAKHLPELKTFFKKAIREAKKAYDQDELPIGCVLVKDGKILAFAFNRTEARSSFFAHAEMLCMEKASRKLKTKYLVGCELYVTLEPCRMCQFAAKLSRIESIHYLLPSESFGSKGKAYRRLRIKRHANEFQNESLRLLKSFFQKKR